MTIKDFTPGQVAFAFEEARGRNSEARTRRMIVASVGRKYVKAALEGSEVTIMFYQKDLNDDFLVENMEYGHPLQLFNSEKALTDHIERLILKSWLIDNTSWYKLSQCSLRQLREIRRILEESERE